MSYEPDTHNPHVAEVIIAYTPRGDGTEDSPHRCVLQVYSKAGDLIAESDPEVTRQEILRKELYK